MRKLHAVLICDRGGKCFCQDPDARLLCEHWHERGALIAELLKRGRKRHQVAAELGVSPAVITYALNGRRGRPGAKPRPKRRWGKIYRRRRRCVICRQLFANTSKRPRMTCSEKCYQALRYQQQQQRRYRRPALKEQRRLAAARLQCLLEMAMRNLDE